MPTDPLAEFLVSHAPAIVRLHRRGNADAFSVTAADLGLALYRGVRAWNAEAKPAEINGYLDKLHADDFVLAVACIQGNERAWEGFIEKYRPLLYGAAHALTRGRTCTVWTRARTNGARCSPTMAGAVHLGPGYTRCSRGASLI
jgi:hypothetical protein